MIPLIVNPVAGGGRARRVAERAAAALASQGVTADIRYTSRPGDARVLAMAAMAEGVDRVLACGGDGTLHEAATALAGSDTALGILPFGRGNDLAAALGVPRNVAGAAAIIARGQRRRIDLGVVNGEVICTVAAAGLDSEVAHRVRAGGWKYFGRFSYVAGVLRTMFSYQAAEMRLEGDFGVREGRYLLVAASNTGTYGGGIRVAPDSRSDDGLLDCCLIRDLSRLRLLRIFPTAYHGRHVLFPEVEIVRTSALRIEADRPVPIIADGEPAGQTPAEVTIRRLSLTVLAGT